MVRMSPPPPPAPPPPLDLDLSYLHGGRLDVGMKPYLLSKSEDGTAVMDDLIE
jgi:hypothetical protein